MKMRLKITAVAVLVVMLALPALAGATIYDFTYTDTIATASTPGITAGDTFILNVYGNNGNSTLVSQTWGVPDILKFTISAGSYFATYSTAYPGSYISTDAGGNMSTVAFWGTDYSSHNTDNFGTWVGDYVFGNAAFEDYYARENSIVANTFNNVGQWTVSAASTTVPEPTTILLLGLGLVGLAGVRRKFQK